MEMEKAHVAALSASRSSPRSHVVVAESILLYRVGKSEHIYSLVARGGAHTTNESTTPLRTHAPTHLIVVLLLFFVLFFVLFVLFLLLSLLFLLLFLLLSLGLSLGLVRPRPASR